MTLLPGKESFRPRLPWRHAVGFTAWLIFLVTTVSGVILLAILLYKLALQGAGRVSIGFLDSFPSRHPEKAGFKAALWGSVWVVGLTALISLPVGVGAAVYLEEFAKTAGIRNRWARGFLDRLNQFIEINIANLAGVPSIVYGILGLAVFIRWMSLGRSVIAGALTLTLLILPVIIITSREALRAVPGSIRQAAMALGATRWQTVRSHVLPSALPGILTGLILSLSRAIGETAPLLMLGALTYVAFVPEELDDPFTAMPIQIYNWASRPQAEFHELAAAGIIVLLAVLLTMNGAAILIRYKFSRKLK